MRFLFVISGYPPAKKAGIERNCQRLARLLVEAGDEVLVLTQAFEEPPGESREDGVRVLRVLTPLALGPLWGMTYMRQVRAWMLRAVEQWDVAVCFELYLHSAVASRVCRRLDRRWANYLASAGHVGDVPRLRAHRFGETLLRAALKSDVCFALSRDIADELVAEGVAPGAIWRCHSFADTTAFRPDPATEHDPNRFLYLGRFHEKKNLPGLIEAFEKLTGSHDSARLRLVGSGPDEEAVRARAAVSPAASRIDVINWTDDPAGEYRTALASVTATEFEGLSNVLVECLACGTPAITTDISGARDVLDPDGTAPPRIAPGTFFTGAGGLIVARQDPAGLAAAMAALHGTPALRAELSARAAARVAEAFSHTVAVRSFRSAWKSIVEERPQPDAVRGFPGLDAREPRA